jgi:hypothetical protein
MLARAPWHMVLIGSQLHDKTLYARHCRAKGGIFPASSEFLVSLEWDEDTLRLRCAQPIFAQTPLPQFYNGKDWAMI